MSQHLMHPAFADVGELLFLIQPIKHGPEVNHCDRLRHVGKCALQFPQHSILLLRQRAILHVRIVLCGRQHTKKLRHRFDASSHVYNGKMHPLTRE